MSWLLRFARKRMMELSTWQGIIALLTACGVQISPDLAEALIQLGLAAFAVISVLFPDRIEVRPSPFPDADADGAAAGLRDAGGRLPDSDDRPAVRYQSPDTNAFKDLDRFQ